MAYQTDDIIWRIDKTYLGPPGRTLPWGMKYNAIGTGFCVLLVLLFFLRTVLHMAMSYNLFLMLVVGVVVITQRITKHVDQDTSVSAILVASWNDLVAPRPPKAGAAIRLAPLPARALPRHGSLTGSSSVEVDTRITSRLEAHTA